MQTLESVKNTLESARDLHGVVKTMKAMAAVSIRQYEEAVVALRDYNRTVELALQAVLRDRPRLPARGATAEEGAIVFGSDQGMCGQFNDRVGAFAAGELSGARPALIAMGLRVAGPLEDAGLGPDETMLLPGSIGEISFSVQELLLRIEQWRDRGDVDRVRLFYNRKLSGAGYEPHAVRLLPLDEQWLERLRAEPWPTRSLPLARTGRAGLFASLLRHYFFVSLFRAFAESMASEHASRLAAMQAAEQNIEQRLEELGSLYNRQRQNAITAELLDIVSGFEALRTQS